MKNLFLIGLAVLLLTACQENKPERFTTNSPEIESVKDLLKDYQNGNWEAWVKHYADTAKIHHNNWKTGASPKETVEALKGILANVSTYKFNQNEGEIFYEMVIDDNDLTWVNFWGVWQGTVAGNGVNLDIPVHITSNFVDGKIVREYGYYDLSEFIRNLNEIEASKNEEVVEQE